MKKRFLALHFEVTNKCNLRCKHCYNIKYLEGAAQDLTTEEAKIVIDKAIKLGCEDIGFSGGEPFARHDIIELIEYVKGYPIHILTNGLLITEEQLAAIAAMRNIILEFRISLDGLESHCSLRGVAYTEVLKKIMMVLNRDFVVTINTMATDDSISELDKMYSLFKEIGIDRWRIDFIFNSGNAKSFDKQIKDLSKIKDLILRYVSERPSFELDINKMFRSAFLRAAKPVTYNLSSKPCGYQGSLTIRPNGDVSFCPSMEIVHGNILRDDIDVIVNSRSWQMIANISVGNLHEKCRGCRYLRFCGGGCRADSLYESGSMYKNSNLTCMLVKYYVDEIEPRILDVLTYNTKTLN